MPSGILNSPTSPPCIIALASCVPTSCDGVSPLGTEANCTLAPPTLNCCGALTGGVGGVKVGITGGVMAVPLMIWVMIGVISCVGAKEALWLECHRHNLRYSFHYLVHLR